MDEENGKRTKDRSRQMDGPLVETVGLDQFVKLGEDRDVAVPSERKPGPLLYVSASFCVSISRSSECEPPAGLLQG